MDQLVRRPGSCPSPEPRPTLCFARISSDSLVTIRDLRATAGRRIQDRTTGIFRAPAICYRGRLAMGDRERAGDTGTGHPVWGTDDRGGWTTRRGGRSGGAGRRLRRAARSGPPPGCRLRAGARRAPVATSRRPRRWWRAPFPRNRASYGPLPWERGGAFGDYAAVYGATFWRCGGRWNFLSLRTLQGRARPLGTSRWKV